MFTLQNICLTVIILKKFPTHCLLKTAINPLLPEKKLPKPLSCTVKLRVFSHTVNYKKST